MTIAVVDFSGCCKHKGFSMLKSECTKAIGKVHFKYRGNRDPYSYRMSNKQNGNRITPTIGQIVTSQKLN